MLVLSGAWKERLKSVNIKVQIICIVLIIENNFVLRVGVLEKTIKNTIFTAPIQSDPKALLY